MVELGSARRQMFGDELIQFAAAYDFLIIDVAAGIGTGITTFLNASPEVLVVVANEPTSMMDAYSLIKVMTRSAEPPEISIVVNMVRTIDEGERLAARLNGITKRFLGREFPTAGVVVHEYTVGDAIRARTPIARFAPRSGAAQCMEDVARYVQAMPARAGGAPVEELFARLAGVGVESARSES
jgi:flagellar biosynthesis protein FlhG